RYGIPYFANFVNSDMKPEDARSMCCRLRIDNRKLAKRGGGLFGAHPLTGSIGVVTINLPRIGYTAKNEADFLKRLDKLTEAARKSMKIKRKVLERFTEGGLYPYSKFYLRHIKERFNSYWRNHFSTIGIIGMNEAMVNLLGKDVASKEGNAFAEKIMDHMRGSLQRYQEEDDVNYNLEATPGEGTSYRLALKDKEVFPDIIAANEADVKEGKAEPFYTNSSHLPVNYSDDIFEVLDLQDKLQTKYTGGTVLHIFTGEKLTDIEAVKNMVRKVSENYSLPYFSITPTFSVCPTHGYIAGEYRKCPTCKSETEVYSRVVGYLRPIEQWNKGKKAEFDRRKTYKLERIFKLAGAKVAT
ncbi:anaerobic ribonucleoside-triphosphate reductase, partial [Patescibacteria group bacterium]|nr:anaerobic ribonucleoside-triphosphate reductase [Patescibacteria group bacterium]